MRLYRYICTFLIICSLGYFVFVEQKNSATTTVNAGSIDEDYQAPFNLVYHFYQAIEKNDWKKVKTLVTPTWWAEMHRSGYRQEWESQLKSDPTINFVMFLVTDQRIDFDNNWAWVMGKVDWASARKKMDDNSETVFFIRDKNAWKISSIRINLPVEVVDHFYFSLSEGDFRKIPSFFIREYWKLLEQAGIIESLKKDWEKNDTGVYCVFTLDNFGIREENAWVKGDVIWNPLTKNQKETPVTIHLVDNNGWKIKKIVGHWEIKK